MAASSFELKNVGSASSYTGISSLSNHEDSCSFRKMSVASSCPVVTSSEGRGK